MICIVMRAICVGVYKSCIEFLDKFIRIVVLVFEGGVAVRILNGGILYGQLLL